jgi:hypothetical protein
MQSVSFYVGVDAICAVLGVRSLEGLQGGRGGGGGGQVIPEIYFGQLGGICKVDINRTPYSITQLDLINCDGLRRG